MSAPSVVAIMLVSGRPQMVARAAHGFHSQTYGARRLMIYDTGEVDCSHQFESLGRPTARMIAQWHLPEHRGKSIGAIRNLAIKAACEYWYTLPDIIVTFDSDDVSHSRRIEEQVALLVASGAEAVGYNEALFWQGNGQDGIVQARIKSRFVTAKPEDRIPYGAAWIYSNPRPGYAIGASLCFWRETWQRRPFPHLPIPGNRQSAGEDAEWLKGVKCVGASAIEWRSLIPQMSQLFEVVTQAEQIEQPRLICGVHGQNSQAYEIAIGASPYFKRMPQWDDYARETMKL